MVVPDQLPVLSALLWIPLVGALVILCLPKRSVRLIQLAAVIAAAAVLFVAGWLYADYDPVKRGEPYQEKAAWVQIPLSLSMTEGAESRVLMSNYHLSVDGISLPLVFLTALVALMAMFASFHIVKRWKAFYIWFLILETGMLGVFLARDLLLFFIFFEVALVPVFFLIGIWGEANREKAAKQFLIYNGIGSAFMLIAFLILIAAAGMTEASGTLHGSVVHSADYDTILRNLTGSGTEAAAAGMNPALIRAVLLLLLIAFGIKLPMFPFHTWMLRVHVEAPPSIVMIHSGILLKMGAYGLIRFGVFLFPEQVREWAVVLAVLGLINILYGALLAWVQNDFKLLLAYSSISHMGVVLLGLAAFNETGFQGAVYQMVSHGLISALLFLVIGCLYVRTGTSMIDQMGGFAKAVPFTAGILLVGGLASLGLPSLAGFVAEWLTFLGLFETMKAAALIGLLGIVFSAAYVLRGVLGITFGPLQIQPSVRLSDARMSETVPMVTLAAFIILLGIYPSILLDPLQTGFDSLLQSAAAKTGG
jgi:NADH-quinone oxidoreductase subunit M